MDRNISIFNNLYFRENIFCVPEIILIINKFIFKLELIFHLNQPKNQKTKINGCSC